MNIAVWKTGHEIADTVANAVVSGLDNARTYSIGETIPDYYIQICYGILRGGTEVFRRARQNNKPFFIIDRAYWKPGHYDGYYRISLNGTQQTTGLDNLEPDYERWDKLGLQILPERLIEEGPELYKRHPKLFCPPTEPVCAFFDVKPWEKPKGLIDYWREKDTNESLQAQLDKCKSVDTFNSSVGWEALRQGIPVISDPNHSFLGAYMKTVDSMSQMDIDSRRRCFAVQAGLQLTLDEMRSGLLWPLIQKLLNASSKNSL